MDQCGALRPDQDIDLARHLIERAEQLSLADVRMFPRPESVGRASTRRNRFHRLSTALDSAGDGRRRGIGPEARGGTEILPRTRGRAAVLLLDLARVSCLISYES